MKRSFKKPEKREFFRVFDNQTGRYMCSGYNCKSEQDLLRSFLSYFSIDHTDEELFEIETTGILSYLREYGFSIERSFRVMPFPKSHVYN